MGRGRAKAKQTKVARELKYHTLDMDVTALQRELGGDADGDGSVDSAGVDETDDDAGYPDYADDEDERASRR